METWQPLCEGLTEGTREVQGDRGKNGGRSSRFRLAGFLQPEMCACSYSCRDGTGDKRTLQLSNGKCYTYMKDEKDEDSAVLFGKDCMTI